MSQLEDNFLIISIPKTKYNNKSKHYVVLTSNNQTDTSLVIGKLTVYGAVRAISNYYTEAEEIVKNLLH